MNFKKICATHNLILLITLVTLALVIVLLVRQGSEGFNNPGYSFNNTSNKKLQPGLNRGKMNDISGLKGVSSNMKNYIYDYATNHLASLTREQQRRRGLAAQEGGSLHMGPN
jgi:hypothetical protein